MSIIQKILNDDQTKGNGEIITAKHDYSKKLYFDALYVEGLRK